MQKKKVAILGGGMSALTTAWILSHYPEQYEVTVYQLGWRLGGKTATGRGRYDRIEEHGIHVMMGWYDNAFRLLRAVYEERLREGLDPQSPLQTWQQSVVGTNVMTLPQYDPRSGKWAGWTLVFPMNKDEPGGPPVPFMQLVKQAAELTIELIFDIDPEPAAAAVPPSSSRTSRVHGTELFSSTDPRTDAPRPDAAPTSVMGRLVGAAAHAMPIGSPDREQLAQFVTQRLGVKTGIFGRPDPKKAQNAVKDLLAEIHRPESYHITIKGRTAHPREHLFSFLEDLIAWLRGFEHLVEGGLEDLASLLKRVFGGVIRDINVVLDALLTALTDIAPFGSKLQHIVLLLDFVLVNLRGLFATVYDKNTCMFDFQRIDKYDYREWLLLNGGSKALVESVIVRFFYTGTFSNLVGGDTGGLISAAVAVRGLLTFVGYKTAPVFLFTAGTGDSFVMPLYQVLVHRGVKFKFFSKVESLVPGPSGDIERVKIGRQVDLATPSGEYDPVTRAGPAKNIAAWPNRPLYAQIDPAQARELVERNIDLESPWSGWECVGHEELKKDVDFDHLVLGIPIAALPSCCGEILAINERWRNMVKNVKTTATQAMQLWAQPTMAELGLFKSAAGIPEVACPVGCVTYGNGMFSWGDYSCTLWSESWPALAAPRTAIYFGGALPDGPAAPFSDTQYPHRMRERVVGASAQWLTSSGSFFWPAGATGELPQSFNLSALVAPDLPGASGIEKLLDQYFNAAISPSDRYTLAVPGSSQYRLRADDSGFSNLVLTGDWIDYGLNAGYIEGAVIAGHMAAKAIVPPDDVDKAPAEPQRHPDVPW